MSESDDRSARAKTPPPASGEGSAADDRRRVPSSALDVSRFTPKDLSAEWALKGSETLELQGNEQPVLGRYVLLRKIAEGGMGAVFYGTHMHLGTEVAVKILLPNLQAQQSDVVDRFFREARLAAQIQSPHLVRVLDVARDPALGSHYQVMEYVQGETAGAWLERARAQTQCGVPERRALEVVMAATKGLVAAHREGVVHRDVKPANILIPADDEGVLRYAGAKLADLGLARPDIGARGLTDGDLALGTPGFMAPEQTRDATNVGRPADVFAMGATLYALLVGESPFHGSNPFEMLRATVDGKHRPLREVRPDLSAATCEVVERCLRKLPAERLADADALLAALERCHAGLDDPEALTASMPALAGPPTTQPEVAPTTPSGPISVPAPARSALAPWQTAGMVALAVLALALLVPVFRPERRPAGGDDARKIAPEPPPPTDPNGVVAHVVAANGTFLVNEEAAQLVQGVPWAVEYGSDLSTREKGVSLESVGGDVIEVGPRTGVRATRSAAGVETVVAKWGSLDAWLSPRTHLEILRFATLEPMAGAKARVRLATPKGETGAGRRIEAVDGSVLLTARSFAATVPEGLTVTFFVDPTAQLRRRELRFRTEGPLTAELRLRYGRAGAGREIVIPGGSAGSVRTAARGGLSILNAPDSPPGTAMRVEATVRGERKVIDQIQPGRTAEVRLRPRRDRKR
jgi:serine/threonine protein kinase